MPSLWAVQAAKNSKRAEPVPGTSRFISAEMKNNLSVSRDGIQTLNTQLNMYMSGLNSVVDSLNSGASYTTLSEQLSDLIIPQEIPAVEDSSRSYSALLKSELDLSDGSRPELNLSRGERIPKLDILSASEPISRSGSADPHTGDEQPIPLDSGEPNRAAESSGPSIEKAETPAFENDNLKENGAETDAFEESEPENVPLSTEPEREPIKVKLEPAVFIKKEVRDSGIFPNSKLSAQSPSTFPMSSTPRENSPKQNNIPQNPTGDEEEPTALTPIHVPPAAAPTTSPNVDLSFIPIANSINPKKFDAQPDDSEPDEQSDNSFQAISTAIRKSFAGKLSMGNINSATPLYKEKVRDQAETKKGSSPTTDRTSSIKVKIEQTDSVRKKSIATSRPRSFHQSSKRSSIFVNLPSREPISFQSNKRKSVKVGNGKEAANPTTIKKASTKPSDLTPQRADLRKAESSKTDEAKSSFSNDAKPASSATTIPRLFADNPFFSKPRDSTVAAEKSSQRPSKVTKPGRTSLNSNAALAEKLRKHTTTAAGSPVRSFTNIAPPAAGKLSRGRSRSPVRPLSSSSAMSSRSPTKYSHRADETAFKDSPTDYSGTRTNVTENGKSDLISRLMAPTSSSAAKGLKTPQSKENVLRNRFLTTTLNPEKPPAFGHSSSAQEIGHLESSRSIIPDLKRRESQAKPVTQAPRKFESHSRPKQKITLSLSHKLDVKANTDLRATSRVTTSPKKRERTLPRKPPSTSVERTKRPVESFDSNVAPRKRAVGNAVPLPAAARGKFTKEQKHDKDQPSRVLKEYATPARPGMRKSKSLVAVGGSMSPGIAPDALPEIPSDDDVLRRTKYIKSWAETPEILRTMKEKQALDPVSVFGEVPVLRMEEVFERVAPGKSSNNG